MYCGIPGRIPLISDRRVNIGPSDRWYLIQENLTKLHSRVYRRNSLESPEYFKPEAQDGLFDIRSGPP